MHRESHPLLHPCTPSHHCSLSHRLSISPISDLIRRGEAMMMAAGIEGEDDDDEVLANFLESEILHDDGDEEGGDAAETWPSKRARVEDTGFEEPSSSSSQQRVPPPAAAAMDTGALSQIPPELFHHILKFLSSEDLIACSRVCRFMNLAASDEGLWRRLYCMRWGLASPTGKLRACAWKKLYIQRDQEDMIEFVRNTPSEFKEYYIQMQAAKRSQAPLRSQINDDRVILDRTVADQVSIWKSSRGLSDEAVTGHACSGKTCSYTQIGDVYLCERTGRVHVCDENCREVILDEYSGTLVCIISGHCFDGWLSPVEESDTLDADQQQVGVTDEAEPFMGSGRFARAYLLGYNCADEKELEAALRFC